MAELVEQHDFEELKNLRLGFLLKALHSLVACGGVEERLQSEVLFQNISKQLLHVVQ